MYHSKLSTVLFLKKIFSNTFAAYEPKPKFLQYFRSNKIFWFGFAYILKKKVALLLLICRSLYICTYILKYC